MDLKRKLKWALPLALVMVLIPIGAALAVATVIDHFDSNQSLTLTWPGTPDGANAVPDLTVLGGERDIVGHISIGQSNETLVIQSNNGGDSLFTITSGNSVAGWSEIQYDGSNDIDKSVIDYTGLNSRNLTLLGDRFITTIVFDDNPLDLIISAYTDENNWSSTTINIPGSINIRNVLTLEIPFSSFQTQGSGPANFSNIGALTFRFDATNFDLSAGLDFTVHLIAITDGLYRDFGDLPDEEGFNYDTLLPSGARNIVTTHAITNTNIITPSHSVILGDNVSLESDGQPSTSADLDQFDDGVVRTPGVNWSPATGGSLDITVNYCEVEPCYISAWVDWNGNGDFGTWPSWDLGEQILSDYPVNNGLNAGITVPIPITATINNQSFYARVRIHEGTLAPFEIPSNSMLSGEAEDFLWGFGPTDVTLINIGAQNKNTSIMITVAAVLLLALSGGAILIYKRLRA